jgi:hypothetical protein
LLVVVSFEVNICSILDIAQFQLGDVVFYRALHPGESSLANENGRRPGKIPETAPVWFGEIFTSGLG